MKEILIGKVIAKIFMLIFFSPVTNAFNVMCLFCPEYELSFENRMGTAIEVGCAADKMHRLQEVKPNPVASFTIYGGYYHNPTFTCYVTLSDSQYTLYFTGFDNSFDCKREGICTWQLDRDNPHLYEPSQRRFVKRDYFDLSKM